MFGGHSGLKRSHQALQHPVSQSGTMAGFTHAVPGWQPPVRWHMPDVAIASLEAGRQTNSFPVGKQPSPSAHEGVRGSQAYKHRDSTPSFVSEHAWPSGHVGTFSDPPQKDTHVPLPASSTSKQSSARPQLSMPDAGLPSTVHGSPTWSGSGSRGKHRVAFQTGDRSFAHGMHFSSDAQSWS